MSYHKDFVYYFKKDGKIMRNTEKVIRNLVNPRQEWFLIAKGCKPNQEVADGYGYRKAPDSPGEWDLYQIAEDGQHVQFVWLVND